MKRISTGAYQALRDAIPAIIWNKRPFETWLRTALRDSPELLSGLNFTDTKRAVADALVNRLIRNEYRYQETTLKLMAEISSMSRFPNLEQLKDPVDRKLHLGEAKAAVGHLQDFVKEYASDIASREKEDATRRVRAAQGAALREFNDDLERLRLRFLDLQAGSDARVRGYGLESLLAGLFNLYDFEPRIAYKIDLEQIDGSFSL